MHDKNHWLFQVNNAIVHCSCAATPCDNRRRGSVASRWETVAKRKHQERAESCGKSACCALTCEFQTNFATLIPQSRTHARTYNIS